MLRILLFDDTRGDFSGLRPALEELGHRMVVETSHPQTLWDDVKQHDPGMLVMGTESPGHDMLETLYRITTRCPRPVVLFTRDARRVSIREAVRAGVSAYVVEAGGFAAERLSPIIEAALARFEALQAVRTELEQTRNKLSERKLVDRAKGILMKEKKLPEEDAYRLLRKLAMDRSASLGTVAEQVIAFTKLLA